MNWWQRLRKRDSLERELDAELRFHFESQVADKLRDGMSEQEARRLARLEFGGLDQLKEDCRDARGTRWVHDVAQDLRFAARLLVKDRGFTVVAVVALALGIAVNTTVYTIVNAMVLRGLPVEDPDRIVALQDPGGAPVSVSFRDVEDWRTAARAFEGLAAYSSTSMTLGDEGRSPEVFTGSYISANAFQLLRERPIVGRDFRPDDDRPGAPAVVIVGHSVWVNRYGADPTVIGRTVRISNVPATVIGVMPNGFRFPLIDQLWQPLTAMPGLQTERRDARSLRTFGRLADGITIEQTRSELTSIAFRLANAYPDTNRELRPVVSPFTGTATHPMFVALFGAVAFVVLIACANVANLLLARSAGRSREISVRLSLGATRWRIVRQLLIESVLLAVLAGVAGFLLSIACVRLFSYAVSGINFAYWYHER